MNKKIIGLIGYPVEHSFSTIMHNTALKYLNLDYSYHLFKVKPENLGYAIKGAKALSIKGLNVTIPHKINVIKYLNSIDPIAKLIGAVNTIDFTNLKGYNTDGFGALKAISEVESIKNKKIVIIGSGGAARAISFQFASSQIESLSIINRNSIKAKNLMNDILKSNLLNNIKYGSLSKLSEFLNDADILIDTTPVGMYPNINDKAIATSEMFHEDLIVNDIVYNPIETPLIKEAKKANCRTISGIKMLIYQGAESFKIWTGHDAPIDIMEKSIENYLKKSDYNNI